MPIEVILPKLEMAQESATIIEWLKQEGDSVEKGEPLLMMETDKVTFELEAPGSGLLAVIRGELGVEIPVTTIIAYLLEPGEQVPVAEAPQPQDDEMVVTTQVQINASPVARRLASQHGIDLSTIAGSGSRGQITRGDVEAAIAAPSKTGPGMPASKVRAAPAARRLAKERDLEISQIQGSGPRGQVTKDDVLAFASAPGYSGPAIKETVALNGIRRRIAERMTHSFQTSPHLSVSLQVNMSKLDALRSQMNEEKVENGSPHISVTAMITKVVAMVIERHPWVNSSIEGDQIHIYDDINIGVAVAIEGGLIVPVVRDVNIKGVSDIAGEINDLAARARDGSLTLSDVSAGTFTISNLGPFGVDQFTAIINPPQAAILALGATRPTVLADEHGEIVAHPTAWMTLSADHRIVDGAVAAQFLTDLRDSVEDIDQLTRIEDFC
jgi:pyruvate dehydrogenase E2 component (dihydrolipoamide acetyltransferase)